MAEDDIQDDEFDDVSDNSEPLFILSKVQGGNAIGVITVDVESDESITYSSDITSHPVEEGYDATDHSRPKPDIIQANCFVSNSPLNAADLARAGGAPNPIVFLNGKMQQRETSEVVGYADRVHNQLRDLQLNAELVTVITTRGSYSSMMITNVVITTDSKTYNGLKFSVTFTFFRVVKNKLTRNVISKDKRVAAAVSKGPVTPQATPVVKKNNSAAKALIAWFKK